MAPEIFQLLEQSGAGFAETQDATMAIFRMATDQTVAGNVLIWSHSRSVAYILYQ